MMAVFSSYARFWPQITFLDVSQRMALGLVACVLGAPAQAATDPFDLLWQHAPAALLDQRLPVPTPIPEGHTTRSAWQVRAEGSAYAASKVLNVVGAEASLPRLVATQPTEHGILTTRAILSASFSGWEASLSYRQLYSASVRDGALQIIRAYTAPEILPEAKSIVFDTQLKLLDFSGLGIARSWPVVLDERSGKIIFTAGTRLQTIRRFASFQASGNLLRTRDTYEFDGSGELRDSRRRFEGYGEPGTQGESFGLDIGFAWFPNGRSSLYLSVVDAWSSARIPEVAAQTAALRSDTRIVNDQGFLISQPLVEGRYSAESLRFKLPPVHTVAITSVWTIPSGGSNAPHQPAGLAITAGFRAQRTGAVTLYSTWASTPISGSCHAVAEAEFTFDSRGVGLSCHWGQLMLRSSSVSLPNARSLGLSLAFHHRVGL